MVVLAERVHLGEERLQSLGIDVATVDLAVRCKRVETCIQTGQSDRVIGLTVEVLDLVPDSVINMLQPMSACLMDERQTRKLTQYWRSL